MSDESVIESFLYALQTKEPTQMAIYCLPGIQYFDPLYSYLTGSHVQTMWNYFFTTTDAFVVEYDSIKDLKEGYFSVCSALFFKRNGRSISLQSTFYFKMEEGFISEYSQGFSLHKFCKQAYGFLGWLLGWNRYYQNRVRNLARRQLYIKFLG